MTIKKQKKRLKGAFLSIKNRLPPCENGKNMLQ